MSPGLSNNLAANPSLTPFVMEQTESVVTLKVTKVGVMNRRDETADGPKKPSKKWKQWGLILTSAQLLFFKDTIWTSALQSQIIDQMGDAQVSEEPVDVTISPRISYFRPDGVLSLSDAIAIYDAETAKYANTFRLLAPQGGHVRQYLIQAASFDDMVDWMTKINYCAAFRSVGIRRLDAFTTEERQSLFDLAGQGYSFEEQLAQSGALMKRRLDERADEVGPRLEQVTYALDMLLDELDESLRLARHFNIMTPFLKSTRDRIEAAAVPLAAKVRRLRLDAVKLDARRTILAKDFETVRRLSRVPSPFEQQRAEFADGPYDPAYNGGATRGNLHIDTAPDPLEPSPRPPEELTPMVRNSQESDNEGPLGSPKAGSMRTPAQPSRTAPPVTPLWDPPPTPYDEAPLDDQRSEPPTPPRAYEDAMQTQGEEAAQWNATAVAPEKRISLAALPSISANDMETLTRTHRPTSRRPPPRSSVISMAFTAPNFSINDPGPFGS